MTAFNPAEWQKTLRERREKIGITQADFANIANLSKNYYYEIETGRREVSARMRDKIEHGFDLLQPNPLYMLIDYVKIRFKTTNAKYVIEKILKINMKYMAHDEKRPNHYDGRYYNGAVEVIHSSDETYGTIVELKGKGYEAARSGVAVSDTPTGPYRFIRSGRVNAGKLPFDMDEQAQATMDTLNALHYAKWWTPQWVDAVGKGLILKRDFEGGQMARDMTVYVDDDGKAYHIFASEENLTLHIAELSDDYLSHTGKYVRVAPAGQNEAPAIFKKDGMYWMITSGCTGWAPNEARMFSAPSIWGPWTQHPNPCVGPNREITFGGQSTYILKVEGRKDCFIFMGDIWRPEHPSDARYIWLPIQFKDGVPVVEWKDSWTLD